MKDVSDRILAWDLSPQQPHNLWTLLPTRVAILQAPWEARPGTWDSQGPPLLQLWGVRLNHIINLMKHS